MAFGLLLALLLGYLVLNVFLRLFIFDTEQRDFDLYRQFKEAAEQVEIYKAEKGTYPADLTLISNEIICSRKYLNFCTKMHYRPLPDNSGFRMAAQSLSWPIFYYHSDYSKNTTHTNWALPPGSTPKEIFPVYKETPPIFEHPEEWPEL